MCNQHFQADAATSYINLASHTSHLQIRIRIGLNFFKRVIFLWFFLNTHHLLTRLLNTKGKTFFKLTLILLSALLLHNSYKFSCMCVIQKTILMLCYTFLGLWIWLATYESRYLRGPSQMTSAYFWSFLTPPPPLVSTCQNLDTPLSDDVRSVHPPPPFEKISRNYIYPINTIITIISLLKIFLFI